MAGPTPAAVEIFQTGEAPTAAFDGRVRRHRPGRHRTSPVREDGLYDIDDVAVFVGLDIGKSAHHGTG
ncbi:hypothetical protein AB0M05_42400 [Streptomyces violaceusniger]|uniref:hypothetical protein n=1 Tax=Streptomyces violaceusniger TaxID=68280 RepID=UPI00343C2846